MCTSNLFLYVHTYYVKCLQKNRLIFPKCERVFEMRERERESILNKKGWSKLQSS